MEVEEAPGRDVERRTARSDHRPVVDQARIGSSLVGAEEIDDRVPTDLLLAVARHPDVHGQRPGRGELRDRLEDHVEVALVVGDAPGEELAVADSRLEGRALPQLERRRWLHVEVAVDEYRRRGTPL